MAGGGLLRTFIPRRHQQRPVILSYHRIAEPTHDPWGLAVSPRHFAEQLELLSRTRSVLTLDELVGELERGTAPPNAAAVSFDDGYRDNFTVARPLLEKYGVPATLFVMTGAIGSDVGFWWDELADALLRAAGMRGRLESCDLSFGLPPLERTDTRHWRAAEGAVSTRQALYLEVWRRLKLADERARSSAMAEIRELFGSAPPEPDALPMTAEQLAFLADGGLISIGAHSVHHPPLGILSPQEQRAEIAESLRVCRELAGNAVRGFAYPYGDRSLSATEAVRACGFAWACSTESSAIGSYAPFDLPRVQVLDWNGDTFGAKLRAVEADAGRGH